METMNGRFDQALAFSLVAETGSFTKAAERMSVSKAHISKQVAELERSLGVQLLFRTTRRITLTDTGKLYLDFAKQVRDTLAEAERAVSATRAEVDGTLRLTAPTAFGDAFLPDLLIAFRKKYPDVRIQLDLSIVRRDLVEDGYDFAIRSSRTLEDHLIARPLGVTRDWIVAAPELFGRRALPAAPGELAQWPVINNAHFCDDPLWTLSRDGVAETITLSSGLAVNHFGAIRRAVLRGAGIARLPCYLVRDDIQEGRLLRLLPDWELPTTPLHLVYPSRRHMPQRNRVFMEFLLEWFAAPERSASFR